MIESKFENLFFVCAFTIVSTKAQLLMLTGNSEKQIRKKSTCLCRLFFSKHMPCINRVMLSLLNNICLQKNVYVNDFFKFQIMLSFFKYSFSLILILILFCLSSGINGEAFYLNGERENLGFAYEFKVRRKLFLNEIFKI